MQGCAGAAWRLSEEPLCTQESPHPLSGVHQVFRNRCPLGIGAQSELGAEPGEPHDLSSGGQAGASASHLEQGTLQPRLPGLENRA